MILFAALFSLKFRYRLRQIANPLSRVPLLSHTIFNISICIHRNKTFLDTKVSRIEIKPIYSHKRQCGNIPCDSCKCETVCKSCMVNALVLRNHLKPVLLSLNSYINWKMPYSEKRREKFSLTALKTNYLSQTGGAKEFRSNILKCYKTSNWSINGFINSFRLRA